MGTQTLILVVIFFTWVELDWSFFSPQLSHFPVFPMCFFTPLLPGDAQAQEVGASPGAAGEGKHHAWESTGKSGATHFTHWMLPKPYHLDSLPTQIQNIRRLLWDHLLPRYSANQPIFFLPALNVLASASHFGFLGVSAGVPWYPMISFPLSTGSYTWKWRHLWIYFFPWTIHRCILLSDRNVPHPTITFLALFYTISSFYFQEEDSGCGTLFWYQSLCHT